MVALVSQLVGAVLTLLQLVLFALTLGLTVLSFQAYQRRRTDRPETAFVGFAFISMGVGLTALGTQGAGDSLRLRRLLRIAGTMPFVVGFLIQVTSAYPRLQAGVKR